MTNRNLLASTSIFLTFLVMGFGDVSGPLAIQLQNDFELNNFQAGLVTFMAFILFGCVADLFGLMAGFAVPGCCTIYNLLVAMRSIKT